VQRRKQSDRTQHHGANGPITNPIGVRQMNLRSTISGESMNVQNHNAFFELFLASVSEPFKNG
jgi:hypothetical protein